MKYIITVLVLLGMFNLSAQTKSIQYSPPLMSGPAESVGVSQERLDRIDKMCIQAIQEEQVPGIVAIVTRKGKVIMHNAYGKADLESPHSLRQLQLLR